MPIEITSLEYLLASGFDQIIDVRSPAEWAIDHVPGAVNLPVLDDAERATVGTIYVQQSRFLARKVGAALVARNAAHHLETALADRSAKFRPLIYCWRGGQRSGAFALILAQVGWRAETLAGGYQTFRRLVVDRVYDQPFPAPLVVLDGNTGTAKTEVLGHLAAMGQQVIDLEALANHRGSLFGQRPGGQPSQKAFESALAMRMAALDPDRPVIVEAESSKIGDRVIPPAVWQAMRAAPRIVVAAPLSARAAYLARVYGDIAAEPVLLTGLIDRLRPMQPRRLIEEWQALAEAGALAALAQGLMQAHYDPRYAKARVQAWGADHGVGPQIMAEDLTPPGVADIARQVVAALPGLKLAV